MLIPFFTNSENGPADFCKKSSATKASRRPGHAADLDSTGVKQAIELLPKFFDIKYSGCLKGLNSTKIKRGNPCKDVNTFRNVLQRTAGCFTNGLDSPVNNALCPCNSGLSGSQQKNELIYPIPVCITLP
jgi:hypothetical protein